MRTRSEEEILRKGLAATAVLTSLVLAGCGGGSAETPPTGEGGSSESAPAPSNESESQRTAPAKSLELPEECAIVTQQQSQELGADQQPRQRESVGTSGCQYESGKASTGWAVFVAADTKETLADFKKERGTLADDVEISGYPAAQVDTTDTDCMVSVDVSDNGSLFVQTLSPQGNPAPCELSKKFAEAAVKNLPDA